MSNRSNSGTCLLTSGSREKTSPVPAAAPGQGGQRGAGYEFAQECRDRRILRRPKCPLSRMAAEKLVKLGYENIRAHEGGLEEWRAAGLSIERSKFANHH